MYSNSEIQLFINMFNVATIDIDGIIGPESTAAILKFQNQNNLTPDGIWGSETNACASQITKEVQEALREKCYICKPDGIPGPQTLAAIESFQENNGLTADGIVGPLTRAALLGEDCDNHIYSFYDPDDLPNFTADEFKCQCGCGGDIQPFMKCKMQSLRNLLNETLNDGVDHSIIVTSGYRCVSHNKDVGGVDGSLHTKGLAVDCYTPGMNEAKFEAIINAAHTIGLTCGRYNKSGFVHVQYGSSDFVGD